ncbi:serine/threonine-protein kinase [Collimonas sp. PA-H2]|nr:serine/threonine-protein kinase [Collimonas sp. PA-H2]PFH08511.1 serine/threonine-protein kinase [Collimonas sp. PA-H2]
MHARVTLPATEHYQFLRLLGEGGFGQVYEAWDAKLCRSIAVKRLKSASAPLRPDSLLQEARLAASLKHQAFVTVFSIDGDGAQQSIIMELVQGDTLRQLSQERPLSVSAALDIVAQIAEAMEEAHAAHLIHGDIKPSNLMVEASGKVRILDFGLARQIDPLATESLAHEDTQGTIAYLAPERLQGERPGAPSDIYSLGVVLYELLTGERPFAQLNGLALAAAHVQSSSALWPFPPQIDAAVVALVRMMTARETARRPPSMRAVREAILAISGRTVQPIQSAGIASAAPWRRFARLRTAIGKIGRLTPASYRASGRLTLLILLLATIVGLWQLHDSDQHGKPPLPPYSETATMQSGLTALRQFDRPDSSELAIRDFTSVLEHRPGHAAAAAGLSLAYSLRYASDQRDEVWLQRADASAQLALKQDDQLALAYVAQAWVRVQQGHLEQAVPLVDQALKLDPLDLYALNVKSELLLRMHRFDEAERGIQAAIAAYPQERLFADLLGILRYRQGNYPAAEQAFRHSIELQPDAIQAYANLSQALLRQNRGDQALRVLQQGLQIRPNGRLYSNLGTTLFSRGDYVGAAQAFEHAVSADKGSPGDYLKWANLADTLRWIPGRAATSRAAYAKAAELLKPLLEHAPADPTDISRMGLYSAKLGEREAAARLSRQAVAAAPSNADVHFRAAVAYEINGDRAASLAELRQAETLGYPANLIRAEPDLMALRRDSGYYIALHNSPPTLNESAK